MKKTKISIWNKKGLFVRTTKKEKEAIHSDTMTQKPRPPSKHNINTLLTTNTSSCSFQLR